MPIGDAPEDNSQTRGSEWAGNLQLGMAGAVLVIVDCIVASLCQDNRGMSTSGDFLMMLKFWLSGWRRIRKRWAGKVACLCNHQVIWIIV